MAAAPRRWWSSRRGTITATARCFDDKHVARRQFGPVGAGHHVAAAVFALDPLTAEGSIGAAGEPERGDVPAGRDDDGGHRLEKSNPPHRTIAAAPGSSAAGAAADRKCLEPH